MKEKIKMPVSNEKKKTVGKGGSQRKTAQLIPPHILSIIKRFTRDTKHILQKNVIAEYLFGSYATNTYTPLSDIDILIVVKTFTPEIRRLMSGLASEYSLEYDVYISPIIKDYRVWSKNKHYHTLFYQEVTKHGIPL